MTKKQRQRLCELQKLISKKGSYSFGFDSESFATALRMAKGYKDIAKVLYSVLTDDAENDYRDEDWQEGTEALERLKQE